MQAAITDFEKGASDSETFAALIKESHRDFYVVQDDLQSIVGERFKAEEMLATVQQLKDFADSFECIVKQAKSKQVNTDELVELQSRLGQIVSSVSSASAAGVKLPVQIACPDCRQSNEVIPGTVPGSSAMPVCKCGTRFHVHRAVQGDAFTRRWGASASLMVSVRHVRVTCPNCAGNDVSIRVLEGDDYPQTKWCLNCYARLVIDPASERVLIAEPEDPLEGVVVAEAGGKSVVQCNVCNGQSRAFARRDAYVYARCFTDRRLVRASAEQPPVNPVIASQLVGFGGAGHSDPEQPPAEG